MPGSEGLEGEPVQARMEKPDEEKGRVFIGIRDYPIEPASCKATWWKGKEKGQTGTVPGSHETAAQDFMN